MIEFIGRLHPAIVHLPIGIFILFIILEFASFSPNRKNWNSVIIPIISIGIFFSLLSLLTGFLLSKEELNNTASVDLHKWFAVGTTLLFVIYLFLRKYIINNRLLYIATLILLTTSIGFTGHLGGSLTHGENYLSLNKQKSNLQQPLKITNINDADIYKDIVQHTLNMKCVQCHGADKQKGGLRLDDTNWIINGGKNGAVINKQDPNQSELIKRMLLELNDEHHMPPKGKPQLTAFEQNILQWWISNGASFNGIVAKFNPDDKIMKSLIDFKNHYAKNTIANKREEVSAITIDQKKALEQSGWVIAEISAEDRHIRAVGYNLEKPLNQAIEKLTSVKDQLVELKLSSSGITDNDIVTIGKLSNLEKLWLDGNNITDKSIVPILGLKELSYLNLSTTNISEQGIASLKSLTKLSSVYLYKPDKQKTDTLAKKKIINN